MSDEAFSSHNVFFAWAAQVSVAQLGARVVAYTDTKRSVTALRLLAQRGGATGLGALPAEVIELIAQELRESVFQREIRTWIKRTRCLTDTCMPLSHFSRREALQNGLQDDSGQALERRLAGIADDRHGDIKVHMAYILMSGTSLEGDSKFGQQVRVFAQDFGIRPYFLIKKSWEHTSGSYVDSANSAEAYLMLTVIRTPIEASIGDEVACFSIKQAIDVSLLADLSEEQRQRFSQAATVLKLHGYDKDADESERFEMQSDGEESDYGNDSSEDGEDEGLNSEAAVSNSMISSESSKRSTHKPESKLRKERLEPRLMLFGGTEVRV
ncbi:MAG: hypothetical protein Q9169_001588 [Polycauliona sp. 2 TL-2023]